LCHLVGQHAEAEMHRVVRVVFLEGPCRCDMFVAYSEASSNPPKNHPQMDRTVIDHYFSGIVLFYLFGSYYSKYRRIYHNF
jgi:hypothetical protein